METRELLKTIYRDLDWGQALTDLAPRDCGLFLLINCPKCGLPEAIIYKTAMPRITCNRQNKCGYSQSLWDYIQSSKGLSNQETLRELARLADYKLPDLDSEIVERLEDAHAQEEAWKFADSYFQKKLQEEEGKMVLGYLADRGYMPIEIVNMNLGLFPGAEALTVRFKRAGFKKGQVEPVLKAVENITEAYKLTIPYRHMSGRIMGFVVRALDGTDPKYLYTRELRREIPFNLSDARGQTRLLVVEDYLDCLAVQEKAEIYNVVALGDANLSEVRLMWAVRAGAKDLVLALDNDNDGQAGTERALDLIRKWGGIRSYVLLFPDGIKDSDECIRSRGPYAFCELYKNAISGARWKANRILALHDGTDLGRDRALDEAIVYEDGLLDPIERKDLIETVTQGLGLSPEFLEYRIRTYKEERAGGDLKKGYAEPFVEAPELGSGHFPLDPEEPQSLELTGPITGNYEEGHRMNKSQIRFLSRSSIILGVLLILSVVLFEPYDELHELVEHLFQSPRFYIGLVFVFGGILIRKVSKND